jgi:hypothetical protein
MGGFDRFPVLAIQVQCANLKKDYSFILEITPILVSGLASSPGS